MRTITTITEVYKFDELSKESQDIAINDRINDMVVYEWEDHYNNWPEFKKALDKAEEMQTPWFTPHYVWDYCKDAILAHLKNDYEFTHDGKLFS